MANAEGSSQAGQHWLEAKKITHAMLKKLEQIAKDESGGKKLLSDLEGIEHMLETLRLACMATTFTDFKYAHKNRVLDRLWHVHTVIITEYKKGLQRHRSHNQFVQLRNVEKQYAKHLKTAQYFYRGFIERLSARYQLRVLQRIAHFVQPGGSGSALTVDEVIDAEEANLAEELTLACYRTVLHIGDLARYRMNAARQKSQKGGHHPNPGMDIAMMYYSLAQDLMPQEGDAHHQMAVVQAEQHKDFDVVYHFLRSWSVQKPFALAPKNLASEFNKLLQAPYTGARKQNGAPLDPFDTFGSWMARLYANYFRGEEFSSRAELEQEVLHRWEALLKKPEQPESLQKAVLMNMAFYDILYKRVKEEWTEPGSRGCLFSLVFLVRTIQVLSRVLEAGTDKLLDEATLEKQDAEKDTKQDAKRDAKQDTKLDTQVTSASASTTSSATNGKRSRENGRTRGKAAGERGTKVANSSGCWWETKGSSPETCLALFRTCIGWMSLHHEDLVKFHDHLQPFSNDMHRSVTRCLSLLIALIAGTEAASAPYLLPDDIEIIGLAPLHGWSALWSTATDKPGVLKPRYNDSGIERLDTRRETLARIFDVVENAVTLVGIPSFPWMASAVHQGNRDFTKICFAADFEPPTSPSLPFSMDLSIPVAHVPTSPSQGNDLGVSQPYFSPEQPVPHQLSPVAQSYTVSADYGVPGVYADGLAPACLHQKQAMLPPPLSGPPQPQWPSPLAAKSTSYKDMDDIDDFLPGSMKEPPLQSRAFNQMASSSGTDPELDRMGEEALSRIQTFLNPPESHRLPRLHLSGNAQFTQSSSSYGMHTATANSVFGPLQTPSPAAAAAAAAFYAQPSTTLGGPSGPATTFPNPIIPSAPWDHGYVTSPSFNRRAPYTEPASGIEEQLSFLTLAKQQQQQRGAFSGSAGPTAVLSGGTEDAFDGSGNGFVPSPRGFPSGLSPIGTSKTPTSPRGGAGGSGGVTGTSGFHNPWSSPAYFSSSGGPGAIGSGNGSGAVGSSGAGAAASAAANQGLTPQRLPLQQLQQAQAASLGLMGSAYAAPPDTLFSLSNFSVNPMSSLPPVQSPRGLPAPFRQPSPPSMVSRGFPMKPEFADAGTGTSMAVGGLVAGSSSNNSNTMWQEAATAWGRSTTGGAASKDDPTLFRNAVRQTGLMDDSNMYDRNALLSALEDDASNKGKGHQK